MVTKQTTLLIRKPLNLCEIDFEYPVTKVDSIPRHLSTGTTTIKVSHLNLNKDLVKINTNELKDQQQIRTVPMKDEIIEVFLPRDEPQEKLYKKQRYQKSNQSDDFA